MSSHVKNILNCSHCAGMINLVTAKRNSSAVLVLKYYTLSLMHWADRRERHFLWELPNKVRNRQYNADIYIYNDRTIESLRLEKPFKIIKPNHQPNTTTPAKPCPEVPYLHVFWTPPGMVTPPPPWAACPNAWPLFQWKNFSEYPTSASPDATHTRHWRRHKGRKLQVLEMCSFS